MACCDDPTEPKHLDRRDLIREQERYGNLARDLLTEHPEKVMLKLLQSANSYLRELAALGAHYPSVRLRAIGLLDKQSQPVLMQIISKEPDSEFGLAAQNRINSL